MSYFSNDPEPEWKYFSGLDSIARKSPVPDSEEIHKKLDKKFEPKIKENIPADKDPFWKNLYTTFQAEIREKLDRKRKNATLMGTPLTSEQLAQDQNYPDHIFAEYQVKNMLTGTHSLLNLLLERQLEKNPVETLIFLDKSARNGFYLLSTLVESLKKVGFLHEAFQLPQVIFLNVGREKINKGGHVPALLFMGRRIDVSQLAQKNILVVDDMVTFGSSIMGTAVALTQSHQQGKSYPVSFKSIDAISQFATEPPWYGGSSSDEANLGVRDTFEWKDTPEYLEKLYNARIYTELQAIAAQHKEDEERYFQYLEDLVEKAFQDMSIEEIIAIGKIESEVGQERFAKLMQNCEDYRISREEAMSICKFATQVPERDYQAIARYIHHAGGFFTSPLRNRSEQKRFFSLRKDLRALVKKYAQMLAEKLEQSELEKDLDNFKI